MPVFSQKGRRACELWNERETELAHIHLAHAGLQQCGEDEAPRLFIAEEFLENDVPPDALIKALGIDPATLDLFKYPGQLRVPAGNGWQSGEWEYNGANVTPVAFRGCERRPGHRGGGSEFDAIRSFLDWLRARGTPRESEPTPESKPTHEEGFKPEGEPPNIPPCLWNPAFG